MLIYNRYCDLVKGNCDHTCIYHTCDICLYIIDIATLLRVAVTIPVYTIPVIYAYI